MKIENTQSQMRKGVLEYCILTLASAGEMYASDIITHLKDAKLIVVEGTLYPLLTRLKNAGLLKYEWKESDQGPPRKYYSLTEEGQAFTEQLADTWSELKSSVTKITQSK
jgi:PadR family transcriptional regulator PadR|tara:strand:- start:2158 stop:2487 length:330 start_codon:yes stop_codon:yes gene_type:complete